MSYEPTVWECGDTITAEKLNKLEQGVASSGGGTEPLRATLTITEEVIPAEPPATKLTYSVDKTWQEIADAFPNVYIYDEFEENGMHLIEKYPIAQVIFDTSYYGIAYCSGSYDVEQQTYTPNDQCFLLSTDNPNGYPTLEEWLSN